MQPPNGFVPSSYTQSHLNPLIGPETALNEASGDNLPDLTISKVSSSPPVITSLSVNIDRLTVTGVLPTNHLKRVKAVSEANPKSEANPNYNPCLLTAEGFESLKASDYHLVRQPYRIGICKWVYWVYHKNYSDPIGTVRCRPFKGDRRRFWLDLHHHVCYMENGIQLAIGFLSAIGANDTQVTYLEVSGDSPYLNKVLSFVQSSGAKKKNGGKQVFDKHGARFGKRASDRSATFYNNGKTLRQRGKEYIGHKAKNVLQGQDMRKLWRFEWRLNGNESKRLFYKDSEGTQQPITLESLTDSAVVLAIFRTQTETGFIWRLTDPATKKPTELSFFDWEAIGAMELQRSERHLRSDKTTHCRKQMVNGLIQDSRKGDYLVKTLTRNLVADYTETLTAQPSIDGLIDAIMQAPCNLTEKGLRDILTAYGTNAAERMAERTAATIPRQIAQIATEEFNLHGYYRRKKREADALPTVDRPLSTLKNAA